MMKRMWAIVIACVLILTITLVNVEELNIDKRENVSAVSKIDYTVEFNPNNGKFYNSVSAEEITSSALATMGISSVSVSGGYKITFDNINLLTTKGVAFEVVDHNISISPDVVENINIEIVLVGDNELESSYDNEEIVYSCIKNDLTTMTFSGTGTLTATSCNMSPSINTYAHVIRCGEGITINGGTFNLNANGSNGTALFSQDVVKINGGTINAQSNDKSDVYGIYGKLGVDIAGGTINVKTNSTSGMSCGIVSGFINESAGINITGGDINVSVEGNVTNLEDVKSLVKKYEHIAEDCGTTVDSVNEYIESVIVNEGIKNVYQLVSYINSSYTAGMSDFTQIKETFINVFKEIGGYAIGATNISIGGADIDIDINGMHKNGIYTSGSAGLEIKNNAKVDIIADIDRSGINGSTAAATGIISNSGKMQFDKCNVNIEIENSEKKTSAIYGMYINGNNMFVNSGADVCVDVKTGGYALEPTGAENICINGGKLILKAQGVAYNGMVENIKYVSKGTLTPATGVLTVADDYDGIERVKPDTTTNKWNYKYIEFGECYDFALYIASNGKVYKNDTSGAEITSAMLTAVGISTSVVGGEVELTMNNVNFATSVYNALTVESDVKVIIKDGTVNRISGMSDGTEDMAVVMVQNMTTSGSGTLVVDNRYNPSFGSGDSYKINLMSTGNITNNNSNIILTGLDNCKEATGVKLEGNMTINSGSVTVEGGYKTEYVQGAEGNGKELRVNGGYLDVKFRQTSYQTGVESSGAYGVVFSKFFIKGGKVNLDINTEDGSAAGIYCKGGDGTDYLYEQTGGVVKIYAITEKEYNGSSYFSEGIGNCDKIYLNDGSLEIKTSYRLFGSTPIMDAEATKRISITKALDLDGEEVSSPSIVEAYNYSYILIQPIYYFLYQGASGTLYKIIQDESGNSNYEIVDEAGWYTKLGSDGIYDLVLNGFSFSTIGSGGILCGDAQFDIILEEGSVNTIEYNHDLDSENKTYTVGVYVSDGDMSISGGGTLNMNGKAYSADSSNTAKAIGIWCVNLDIKDGAKVNFDLEGPCIYGLYIDEKTELENATVTSHVVKTNQSEDQQALAFMSSSYAINDSSIYVTGGDKSLAFWSWDGMYNINNSLIDVNVVYGGAIAGATSTVINDSTIKFVANDDEGGSYGIYTQENKSQSLEMNNCNVYMDIKGSRCIGIMSSGDMKLNNCVIETYFDVKDTAAGIDCRAVDKNIRGDVYIDNCDITVGIIGTRTTGDNQGIVSRFGSVDVASSKVDVYIDGGDGDGIHAGEYFSDYSNEYDNREIKLQIKSSDIELDVNGKDLAEQCVGVYSTYGDLMVDNSEIVFTNNRAGADCSVVGLLASYELDITNGSSVMVAIEPTSNNASDVFGIYSMGGTLSIGDKSVIGIHIIGDTAYGIKGEGNVVIDTETDMNIDIEGFADMGIGIVSDSGEVLLDNVVDSSITVKVNNVTSDTSSVGISATNSNLFIENSVIDIDTYSKSSMAIMAGNQVVLSGGDITLKAYTKIIGTTSLQLVVGNESIISSMATRAIVGSTMYKDGYADSDLVAYPNSNTIGKYKYAQFKDVPMKYYRFNGTTGVISEVSYDGGTANALTSSTWPSGLSVEDGKLVMNGFEYAAASKQIIECVGDSTVYVDGENKLTVVSGMDTEHTGIYGDSKLDITGTTTGKLNVVVKSMSDARGIAAEKDMNISDTGVIVYTEGINSKGVTSVTGKVALSAADVDISTDEISDTASTDKRYGIYAETGIESLNSKLKVKAATSALYLTDTSASNIRGSVKASENYTDSTLTAVSDVNTSYTANASKYKTLSVIANIMNVVITWNDLEYECEGGSWNVSTGEYDDITWNTKNIDGDMIVVENQTTTAPVDATFAYTPAKGYEDVTGVIKNVLDDTDITNKATRVAASGTLGARLALSGQLSSDAADSVLGTVTVILSE